MKLLSTPALEMDEISIGSIKIPGMTSWNKVRVQLDHPTELVICNNGVLIKKDIRSGRWKFYGAWLQEYEPQINTGLMVYDTAVYLKNPDLTDFSF